MCTTLPPGKLPMQVISALQKLLREGVTTGTPFDVVNEWASKFQRKVNHNNNVITFIEE